jgi:hypothetical protein
MAERLFISHASEDEAAVNRIVAYLEANGTPCWLASRDIPAKSIYADEIAEAMQSCSACAVILSAASNQSKAVKRELELASHYDKPFIPIRIDATEPGRGFDYYLRNMQWFDVTHGGLNALDRIAGVGASAIPRTRARVGGQLTVEHTHITIFPGPDAQVFWNGARIGAVKDGAAKTFNLPSTTGTLQVGFGWMTSRSKLSEPISIDASREPQAIRFRLTKFTMASKVLYWINGVQGPRLLDLSGVDARFQPLSNN